MTDPIQQIEERLNFVDSLKTEQTYNVNHGFYCQQLEDIQNLLKLVRAYEYQFGFLACDFKSQMKDAKEFMDKTKKEIFEKEVKPQ